MLDRIPEDPVGIPLRRVGVARRDDLARRDRRGGERRGEGERPQICFSGICTFSPSSASVTLSWQVRRERAGSGS